MRKYFLIFTFISAIQNVVKILKSEIILISIILITQFKKLKVKHLKAFLEGLKLCHENKNAARKMYSYSKSPQNKNGKKSKAKGNLYEMKKALLSRERSEFS